MLGSFWIAVLQALRARQDIILQYAFLFFLLWRMNKILAMYIRRPVSVWMTLQVYTEVLTPTSIAKSPSHGNIALETAFLWEID